jgi:hypothetical protein
VFAAAVALITCAHTHTHALLCWFIYALQGTPVLEFEPPLKLDEDYTVVSAEPEQLSLKLIEGKKWRATGGLLTLKTIKIDADVIKLGGDAGIQVQCIFCLCYSQLLMHFCVFVEWEQFVFYVNCCLANRPRPRFRAHYILLVRSSTEPAHAWPTSISLAGFCAPALP